MRHDMPKFSLDQIDEVIKNRMKYFLSLRTYLNQMKAGKIPDGEVGAFLYDHLCARVEVSHGLLDKRLNIINALESIVMRKLAAYNVINKALHQSEKEEAMTIVAVLVHYQLAHSEDDKHKSQFHQIEMRAEHVFHEHDTFKLLEKQMRYHVPKWFCTFWKSVYFSSDQRRTEDGGVGLSLRVAFDRQPLGDQLLAIMRTILDQSEQVPSLKKNFAGNSLSTE